MAFPHEVEITVTSAKDLKNVNWRYGRVKPYVVVWVDPNNKCSTRVDDEGDVFPYWDQKLVVPLNAPIQESTLHIDVVHAKAGEDTKPLIGSAKIWLRDVVNEVGIGERAGRKLDLKRPSGRPHRKVEVIVAVREVRYRAPDPYYAPPYAVAPTSRDYSAQPAYGNPYAAPPPLNPYQAAAPPSGYGYGQQAYGRAQPAYGQPDYEQQSSGQHKPKSKYGMGTGLAVGAVAGVLGGLALVEGVDYVKDKIVDDVADRVEDDDDDGGYDDDY